MRVRIGVDEAGRGCVVGPLFVAAAAFTREALDELRRAGVRDSKALTRRRREELEALIRSKAVVLCVKRVEPWSIDLLNLNDAELRVVEEALRELAGRLRKAGVKAECVSIDLFGRRGELERLVKDIFPGAEARLIHDADASLTECSAASIIAKVERDRFIDQLKQAYGDFGSGYPSDPKTRKWLTSLAKLGQPLPYVRRTWRTLLTCAPELYVRKRARRRLADEASL